MKFGSLSHHAQVYEFKPVDPKTKDKSMLWERRGLTKFNEQQTYDAVCPTQLWYVPFPFFPLSML